MSTPAPGVTVLRPLPERHPPSSGRSTGVLAPELLRESIRRLRVHALLYTFTFFMADFFPNLATAEARAHFLGEPAMWVPGTVSIAVALVVAGLTWSSTVPAHVVLNVGLAFGVVSCYGIAIAEYLRISLLNRHWADSRSMGVRTSTRRDASRTSWIG